MGQVAITLHDRIYRLVCDDGDEDRLVELATYVKAKIAQLGAEVGRAGDERLLLMAALTIADELWDARAVVEAYAAAGAATAAVAAASLPVEAVPEPVRRLKSVASRMAAAAADKEVAAADPPKETPRRRDVG